MTTKEKAMDCGNPPPNLKLCKNGECVAMEIANDKLLT